MVILSCDWPGWTCDARLDALQARLQCETDFARRKAIWDEVQRWFWAEVPVVKLGDFFYAPDQPEGRHRIRQPVPTLLLERGSRPVAAGSPDGGAAARWWRGSDWRRWAS